MYANCRITPDGRVIRDPTDAWKAACEKAGCTGVTIHDLRRSACRNLIAGGANEKEVMDLRGWKTRSVFDRYNIVDEGRKLAAALKLDAVLKSGERRVAAMEGAQKGHN